MQSFADWLRGAIPLLQGWPEWLVYAAVMLGFAGLLLLGFVAPFAGITSWVERRIAGRIQFRIGPNRVGPQGFLQWLADGIKCFTKEDLTPREASHLLYWLAPYLVFAGMFATFVALPFGSALVVSDLNVGIFYIVAISSFVVVGLLMAGWSSNSKWSLLGGVRSAAHIVSYEIPSGLAVLAVVLVAGTLSTQGIIAAQGAWPWQWLAFRNPFTALAFLVFFISALAEGNRTPFDLPEAESELVAGYNVEYSGMRFVFFFFAEWANLYVIGALTTLLFLGGWQSPLRLETDGFGLFPFPLEITGTAVFLAKTLSLVFVIIWLRWTLPRLRVDQLMVMCWQYLIPAAFVALLGAGVWELGARALPALGWVCYPLFALAALLSLVLMARVVRNIRRVGDPVNLNPFI